MLRLLNVPLGEDMPVAPFDDLLDLPWQERRISTHGQPSDRAIPVPGSELDRTILEELRALGYVE